MAGLALTQMMKKIGFNNVQLFSNISETEPFSLLNENLMADLRGPRISIE